MMISPLSVADLVKSRHATGSSPGARSDTAKLGLIIEGGGMRGVVSGGMVGALETLDLLHCFDAVYGSSAGSINGAYFLAGQARYGTTIYYQDINNRSFIDMKRLFANRPALSLEFLLDDVAENVKPLRWERVLNSRIPLIAVASSLSEGRAEHLTGFTDKEDLRECLRASARIPIVAGPPVQHRGMILWDALIYEPIPLRAALDDGCTHILALLTRPAAQLRAQLSLFEKHVIAHLIGKYSSRAREAYLARVRQYNDSVNELVGRSGATLGGQTAYLVAQLSPKDPAIKGTEIDHNLLLQGARAGFLSVYRTLGFPEPQVVEVLNAF